MPVSFKHYQDWDREGRYRPASETLVLDGPYPDEHIITSVRVSYMKILSLGALLALFLAGCAMKPDLCMDHGLRGEYDMQVEVCTRDIASGKFAGKGLAMRYVGRSHAHGAKGEFDRVIADSEAALAIDPGNAAALNNRGNAYKDKGDMERAVADFDQAIGIDPAFATPHYNKACVAALKGDAEGACKLLKKALALGYNDLAHMERDPDLVSVRGQQCFIELTNGRK